MIELKYAMEHPDTQAHSIGRMLRALGFNLGRLGKAEGTTLDGHEMNGLGELLEFLGEVLCDAADGAKYLKIPAGPEGKRIVSAIEAAEKESIRGPAA